MSPSSAKVRRRDPGRWVRDGLGVPWETPRWGPEAVPRACQGWRAPLAARRRRRVLGAPRKCLQSLSRVRGAELGEGCRVRYRKEEDGGER